MRVLRLNEFRTARGIELTSSERDGLLRAGAAISVTPVPGTTSQYDVTPSSTIGAVTVGDLAVQLRPKLQVDRVLFLLSHSVDPARWQAMGFDFEEDSSLVEAVVPGFVRQVRAATRRGLLHGYRAIDESLVTVRGRIRIDDQIRRRYGIVPPVEARYDDFTDDIEVNQLLKAAVTRLAAQRIRSKAVRRDLHSLAAMFSHISAVEYQQQRLPELAWSRLNQHYRPAVELARLILQSSSYELLAGRVRSSSFLVDMNVVFENFVVTALREALNLDSRSLRQGDGRLRLDSARSVTLQPDVSWWDGGRCRFVGDVKYKRTDGGGKHPDLYQLLSYVIAANLQRGLLIYAAADGDDTVHEVVNLGRQLEVIALDLSRPPSDLLTEIDALATRIKGTYFGPMTSAAR